LIFVLKSFVITLIFTILYFKRVILCFQHANNSQKRKLCISLSINKKRFGSGGSEVRGTLLIWF